LLSVGQLIKRGFKVTFEDNFCLIRGNVGHVIFKVKMKEIFFCSKSLGGGPSCFSNQGKHQIRGLRIITTKV